MKRGGSAKEEEEVEESEEEEAFVIPISRDPVQSPRRRRETYFQGTYMQRAALLARTFRQSSGRGGLALRHSRETGIFETSTTATPIRDVEMYGSLFLFCLPMSPYRPFLFKPLVVVVVVLLSLLFLLRSLFLPLSVALARSLSLMNSIAINSIKTSVVLGGFHPTPTRRACKGEREEEGKRRKDRGQEVAENPVNSRHGSIDECSVLLKASRLNPSLIGIISNLKLARSGVGSISKPNDIGIARNSGVCK